jgi:stringent starvation protein B
MTSSKPYLIRALYEWILDNDFTPFITIDATNDEVVLPGAFVTDGKMILNVAPQATHNLRIGNDALECKARFGGVSHDLFIPIAAILAIFAEENNQGMIFSKEKPQTEDTPLSKPQPKKARPKLAVIKGELDSE